MSLARDYIAHYWIGKGESDFLVPACELTAEDDNLIKAGVLKLSKEELHTMLCPFGCGETEDITAQIDDDGRLIHYVTCTNGPDEMELEPKDYQLYAFDSVAYERYHGGLAGLIKKKRVRKEKRPRATKWIKIERRAVEEYANDPKRNKSHKEPYELCPVVWRMNQEEFDAAATLPANEAGYANCNSLKMYFYRRRRSYLVNGYGVKIEGDND